MNESRIGIMYLNQARLAPAAAIQAALVKWNQATHTNGFEPMEARFAPAECPEDPLISGYLVIADEQVPAGHVRLTTTELAIESEWSTTLETIRDEIEVGAA